MIRENIFFEAVDKLKGCLPDPIDEKGRSFFIERGKGRRLVLTDIHGSYQTFVKMLKKLDLKKEDQFFILGDMINRAPYSIYVLEKIAELILDGYSIFPLRGNHEQLFIEYADTDRHKLNLLAERQYSLHLLSDQELPQGITTFFKTLPYYYETDKHLMVHAGFQTEKKKPLTSWKDMLWIRSFNYDREKLKNKTVVHGHVPTRLQDIKSRIASGGKHIKLDNGCIRSGVTGYGKLVCWNADSKEFVTQKNVDFRPV